MKTPEEILVNNERKSRDLSLLKRASNILVSVMQIPSIILALKNGHSLVINSDGHLFTGKVNTEKLHDLGQRVAGKNEGQFDVNAHVDSDISMLDNQEIHSKQFSNIRRKALQDTVRLFKEGSSITSEIFMMAWEYQEENFPENVTINRETSPMGHKYLLVKIAGMGFYGKIAEKTGTLMYIVSDGKEIPV